MADETITVDLSNYKDRVGNRVMPGRYRVVVEDAETDTARSGNPMVNVWFRVLHGEFEGATITDRLVMTERSLFRVVGFMQAIGLPTPKKKLRLNIRQLIGQVLDIDVDDGDPYNGRVKSEVRGYLRVTREEREQAASDLSDVGLDEDAEDLEEIQDVSGEDDGLAEFAPETTQNPSAEAAELRQRVDAGQGDDGKPPWRPDEQEEEDRQGQRQEQSGEIDLDKLQL